MGVWEGWWVELLEEDYWDFPVDVLKDPAQRLLATVMETVGSQRLRVGERMEAGGAFDLRADQLYDHDWLEAPWMLPPVVGGAEVLPDPGRFDAWVLLNAADWSEYGVQWTGQQGRASAGALYAPWGPAYREPLETGTYFTVAALTNVPIGSETEETLEEFEVLGGGRRSEMTWFIAWDRWEFPAAGIQVVARSAA